MKAKNIFISMSVSLCALLCALAVGFSGCTTIKYEYLTLSPEETREVLKEMTSDGDKLQLAIGVGAKSHVSVISFFTKEVTTSSGGGRPGATTTTIERYEDFAYDGSGVIVEMNDDCAYVLTNAHMVCCEDDGVVTPIAYKVYLYLYGQDIQGEDYMIYQFEYDASDWTSKYYGYKWNEFECVGDENCRIEADVVAASAQYDLALLKVTDKNGLQIMENNQALAAEFSEDDQVYFGESVFAIGNPYGDGTSVTTGVVSEDTITITNDVLDTGKYYEFRQIKTDAAVNSGNSGGGLYNSNAELIGIVNSKRVTSSAENTGYVLAGSYAKRLVGLMESQQSSNISTHGIWRAYLYYDEELEVDDYYYYTYYYYQSIDTGFAKYSGTSYTNEQGVLVRTEAVACTTNEINEVSEGDIITHLMITDPDGKVVEDLDITRKYILDDALLAIHSKEGYTVTLTINDGKTVDVDYIWVEQD